MHRGCEWSVSCVTFDLWPIIQLNLTAKFVFQRHYVQILQDRRPAAIHPTHSGTELSAVCSVRRFDQSAQAAVKVPQQQGRFHTVCLLVFISIHVSPWLQDNIHSSKECSQDAFRCRPLDIFASDITVFCYNQPVSQYLSWSRLCMSLVHLIIVSGDR